ncbi:MAG: hypothetical protein NWF05_01765 [Candidatus Bathyarchaeota archaeon]|nr:hypothetical protein [Candidatus Bathyarchaeota archaeon]
MNSQYQIEARDNVFKWECIELNGDIAQLKITLSGTQIQRIDYTDPVKVNNENKPLFLSAEVNVNTLTRAVTCKNGTAIGTTMLWMPPNLAPDAKITVWDLPPDKITGTVEESQFTRETPQGSQKNFGVGGSGTINGQAAKFSGFYDLDTGVLIIGVIGIDTIHEPTIQALGITQGIIYEPNMVFSETNIDLGPAHNPSEWQTWITIAAIPLALVIVFVGVIRKRKNPRKDR